MIVFIVFAFSLLLIFWQTLPVISIFFIDLFELHGRHQSWSSGFFGSQPRPKILRNYQGVLLQSMSMYIFPYFCYIVKIAFLLLI